jgi:CelD/BcsL family acetyltransferase involved in cellulose biosynthesis
VLRQDHSQNRLAHGLVRAQAAAPAERRQVLDATVASVLEAAAAAEAEYQALWQASGNRFAAQRAHLANRLRPGPLSSI